MSARKLPYPIYAPIQIEGTSNQALPSLPSLDGWEGATPSDEIDVVFRLSLRQFVQIASMIDIGRDLGYPDESEDLWAMWAGRIISLSICESVENCVDNSDGVREALDRWFESSTGVQTRIESITNNYFATVQPTSTSINCNDELFGGILALVEYIHQRNVDFFEEIEVASNILELASRLTSAVPVIGVITAQLTVSAIEGALENIAENYLAQWTVDSAFDIACDIFCSISCNELSLNTAIDYYEARVASQFEFSILGLLELLESVATGDYTNVVDFIAWASYFQLQFVRLASGDIVSWLAFDVELPRKYGRAIQLGYLNPSAGWTLCDCAPSLDVFYDFEDSQYDWIPAIPERATYVAGQGFARGSNIQFDHVKLEYGTNQPAQTRRLVISAVNMPTGAFAQSEIQYRLGGTLVKTIVLPNDGTFSNYEVTDAIPAHNRVDIYFFRSTGNGSISSDARIQNFGWDVI